MGFITKLKEKLTDAKTRRTLKRIFAFGGAALVGGGLTTGDVATAVNSAEMGETNGEASSGYSETVDMHAMYQELLNKLGVVTDELNQYKQQTNSTIEGLKSENKDISERLEILEYQLAKLTDVQNKLKTLSSQLEDLKEKQTTSNAQTKLLEEELKEIKILMGELKIGSDDVSTDLGKIENELQDVANQVGKITILNLIDRDFSTYKILHLVREDVEDCRFYHCPNGNFVGSYELDGEQVYEAYQAGFHFRSTRDSVQSTYETIQDIFENVVKRYNYTCTKIDNTYMLEYENTKITFELNYKEDSIVSVRYKNDYDPELYVEMHDSKAEYILNEKTILKAIPTYQLYTQLDKILEEASTNEYLLSTQAASYGLNAQMLEHKNNAVIFVRDTRVNNEYNGKAYTYATKDEYYELRKKDGEYEIDRNGSFDSRRQMNEQLEIMADSFIEDSYEATIEYNDERNEYVLYTDIDKLTFVLQDGKLVAAKYLIEEEIRTMKLDIEVLSEQEYKEKFEELKAEMDELIASIENGVVVDQ